MTDKTASVQEIYTALLSPERTAAERLASLHTLQDFLVDEDVALRLGSMAREEKTLEVRAAMLQTFLGIDITRFTRKDAYIDHVFFFVIYEPEGVLRLPAVQRLAGLAAADDHIQNLLAETLLYDLSEEIQHACLSALSRCPRKNATTVEALVDYARTAPRALRGELPSLFGQMERPDCELGLLALLNPLEPVDVRASVLDRLMAFPVISTQVAGRLVDYLPREPDAGLQERVIKALFNAVQADIGLMNVILDRVRASQDQRALLYAFRDRLFSFPDMVGGLRQLFADATSTSLKIELLQLLEPTDSIALFTAALSDPGYWVRYQAIGVCERRLHGHEAEISSAVVARVPQEPLPVLRERLVGLLGKTGRKSPETERFLVRWMVQETSPAIIEQIAAILPDVMMTDLNRRDLLNAYLKVLQEPFYSAKIKEAVTARLTAFSFQDHPDLADCLKALMMRATDLRTVEELHSSLRTLEPDPEKNIDLIRLLFLRFIGEYAQEPLHQWVKDFKAVAPVNESVRREIPYIVRLTGETWILETADVKDQKDNLLPAILEAIRKGAFNEPQRLLKEAYETRTLRKRDLITLYLRLLNYHDQYPLLDDVIRIMIEVRICSPEILDASFRFITAFPDSTATYGIKSYLEKVGPSEPSYLDRVRNAMTPENYRAYGLSNTSPRDENRIPHHWDDSGHWRLPYSGWPVSGIFFELDPEESLRQLLLAPIDPARPALESLHYLLLNQLWRSRKITAEDLAAIGRLMQSSRTIPGYETLYDRAVFTFSDYWPSFVEELKKNPIPPELAAFASEAFAEQCRRWRELEVGGGLSKLPMPLFGMDLKRFETAWNPEGTARDQLWEYYSSFLGEDPRERSRNRSYASPAIIEPSMRFFPVKDPYKLIQFLVMTPVPTEPIWEKRWRSLLQNANKQYGQTLARAIAQVPEAGRERLLSFLK
ncbi:MAG TPA: hypothetical protein VK436_01820 [Methanocella sp.]|nr:hypothetical protein [Methanocella sp.]